MGATTHNSDGSKMSLAYISPAETINDSFPMSSPAQSITPLRNNTLTMGSKPTSPPLTVSPSFSDDAARRDEVAGSSNVPFVDPLLYPSSTVEGSPVYSLFPQNRQSSPLPATPGSQVRHRSQSPLMAHESRRLLSPSLSIAHRSSSPTTASESTPDGRRTSSSTAVSSATEEVPSSPANKLTPNTPFRSNVVAIFARNPALYAQNLRQEYADHRLRMLADVAAKAPKLPTPTSGSAPRRERTLAPAPAPRPRAQPAQRVSPARTNRGKRAHKEAFPEDKKQPKKQRSPPEKKDRPKHWTEAPDYCPPYGLLDDPHVSMRPVFPGGVKAPAPLSLEGDPDRYAMHEKELVCAAALRLSCNDYLINKRLIMAAKREHVRDNNKSFLKTHAQQAGCIDVNKASRLWECFEKVGWFRPEFFYESLAGERTSA